MRVVSDLWGVILKFPGFIGYQDLCVSGVEPRSVHPGLNPDFNAEKRGSEEPPWD